MKRLLTYFFLTCSLALAAQQQCPARLGVRTVRQPDGYELKTSLWGDEWNHGWQTTDGLNIRQAQDGYYYYQQSNGKEQHKYKAHNPQDRTRREQRYIQHRVAPSQSTKTSQSRN